jgi:hypothetical protein
MDQLPTWLNPSLGGVALSNSATKVEESSNAVWTTYIRTVELHAVELHAVELHAVELGAVNLLSVHLVARKVMYAR